MKILLLGTVGQLGWELHRTLSPLGELTALDYPHIDLRDPGSVREVIRQENPDLIVDATAFTAVDRAEEESDQAHALNALAPEILAEEALHHGAELIHFSTDYVFDGETSLSYKEVDPPNPINMYSQTKLAGEQAIAQVGGRYLIFRTSWVYSFRRPCFPMKVLSWARKYELLRVVDDQVGSPTWCRMLAEATALVLAMGASDIQGWIEEYTGLYHLAGEGIVSRFKWAKAIIDMAPNRKDQVIQQLIAAKSEDFPTPARRPEYSALYCDHFEETFGVCLPHWEDALSLAIAGINTNS
jgi:dTDP-4-dehydrorhamnose reductase